MKRSRWLVALFVAGAAVTPIAATAQDDPLSSSPDDATGLDEVLEGFRALRDWQYGEARAIAERLMTTRPNDPLVDALVGTVKMHLGDYGGAVADLRRARDAGVPEPLLAEAQAAEAARVATDGYAETVGEHFILRYRPGKDEILVPYAKETMEKAIERIGELLGWKPKVRVVVEFYPAASTLARVSSLTDDDIRNSGTIALCRWNRLMVTTPRGVMFGYSWRDTLAHELVHLLIGGVSKNTVPIWLHEGIAKYAETAWRTEPGRGLAESQQRRLREAAQNDQLIPFEKMHPSMAKLPTQEQSSLAFAEVFTFIEYLIEKKGWEGIRRVLRSMGSGQSEERAIAEVYGAPLKTLAKRWMRSLKTRKIRTASGAVASDRRLVIKDSGDVPDDKLHGLSKQGRRFARAADLLYARGRMKAAQKELQKAFDATKSPLISAKLAVLALQNGDLKAAEVAALNAVDGTPDLAGPNVTLAEILLRTGRTDAAWEPLAKAVDINPFDPRIHSLRLALLGDKGDPAEKAEAARALALIASGRAPAAPRLGQGGLIQVEGPAFRRVYLQRLPEDGGEEAEPNVPTGFVTPTPPFGVKPGRYRLQLVPANGPPVTKTIQVQPAASDGSPQPVTPPADGS